MRRVLPLILLFLLIGTVTLAPRAMGQDEAAAEDGGGVARLFDHFVGDGGPITWFILIPLSVATIALTVEHALSIRRSTLLPAEVEDRLAALLEKKQYAEALQLSGEDDSMLGRAVNAGLSEAANGYLEMERSLDEALDERAARLTRKIEYLNVIGNVSPMIGLFGTVYGMIKAFASIGDFGGNLDPGQIADDISIALVTTFWGLLVAIPALTIFALFRNRIDLLTAECALVAERLLAVFKPAGGQRSAAVAKTAPAAAKTAPATQKTEPPTKTAPTAPDSVPGDEE
ncbi:MAG: MotA/TolQ/ExbB proton channel family protein [bacterium]|nr:MotA/TolQ/ExbB proton channel family protein [bacterium]